MQSLEEEVIAGFEFEFEFESEFAALMSTTRWKKWVEVEIESELVLELV